MTLTMATKRVNETLMWVIVPAGATVETVVTLAGSWLQGRMSQARQTLYVTADGIMEPVGFSQVARVVMALAERGWPYTIVSLEKEGDLARTEKRAAVQRALEAKGVCWRPIAYDWSQTGQAALQNLKALTQATVKELRSSDVGLVHARAYHGALAAFAGWLSTGVPYLFDTRCYWIDERLEEGRWFTSPVRLAVARGVEQNLFRSAAGVVTLTELQASDVRGGRFGALGEQVVQCVPTCADYDDFVRRPLSQLTSVPADVVRALKGTLSLGIVGSLNRSYLVDETLELCRRVLARVPHARVLILSAQTDAYRQAVQRAGLDEARVIITRADHDAMPHWLSLIDYGLLLLQPASPAKRASVPTKLAEFFAAGVRPVQFGCNSEVSDWVRRAGSGFVLDAVDGAGLERAAAWIASEGRPQRELVTARERTEGHFSLRAGVDRYERVLRALHTRRSR